MPLPGTARETTALLWAFARKTGQTPILVRKESPGYVFNATYNSINREAITLAANEVASVEDVDRAWMGIFKVPIGPFGTLDGVGLDTVWHISDYWAGRTGDAQMRRNADFLKGYLDRGCLGIKSGEGFYRYPSPAYGRADFVTSGTRDVEDMASAAPPTAPLDPSPPQEREWGFRGQRGIITAFAPADPALYRSLLPPAFDPPESPLVVVTVVSYHDVTLPLVPYCEGYVLLQCRYRGRTGWYVLTMPVDDETANAGGRSIGFPRYVADSIDLGETDGAWRGRVTHQGREIMAVAFRSNADAEPVATSSTDAGSPCFLLLPPAQGPLVNQVDGRLSGPRRTVTTAGSATVQADPGEAWAGSLPAGGGPVHATFDEPTGDWSLAEAGSSHPMPRSLGGTLQRLRGKRP